MSVFIIMGLVLASASFALLQVLYNSAGQQGSCRQPGTALQLVAAARAGGPVCGTGLTPEWI